MLLALVLLAYLYISPIRGLVADHHQVAAREAQLRALERTAKQLRAEELGLEQPSTAEREARNLGLVRPGERAYVVSGLPNN
jgi:cell division protein FtsB